MPNEVYDFRQHLKWNKVFSSLLYGPDENGNPKANFDLAIPFENDLFIYRPFYDGECDCGYLEKQEKIFESEHNDYCPTKYLTDVFCLFLHFGMKSHSIEKILRNEIERFGFMYNPNCELDYFCICNWKKRVKKWETHNDHLDTCSIVQPNFYYKKTNLKLYCTSKVNKGFIVNQNISFQEFHSIIKECSLSI